MPGNIINKKDNPANNNPSENFTTVDGCRFPNLVHNVTNTGVKTKMKIGFNDWYQLAGIFIPNNVDCVRSCANRAKMEDPCSCNDQKMIAAKNNGIYAHTFGFSSAVTFLAVNILTK